MLFVAYESLWKSPVTAIL